MATNDLKTLSLELDGKVARVTLDRPEVHNAFNDTMIAELASVFAGIGGKEQIRAVVLTGRGKSFCAGADLVWMKRVKDYTYEQNLEESRALAAMFHTIYSCPKPTIGRIQGTAIGGGTGLVAVCDIAVASSEARFSFSEVKLGLIPACISPYVIKKCGEGKVRELFLTGDRISADEARAAGLVNFVVPAGDLDQRVDALVERLASSGPEALKRCKELIAKVPALAVEEMKEYTAEVIARMRLSPEAQEGMDAFLTKRPPAWDKDRGRKP